MAKNEKKKVLKKQKAEFQLIGEAKVNDFTFALECESGKSDWIYNKLNLGVDCGQGNTVYSQMMGGYGAERENVLYVHGKKTNDSGKEVDDYDSRYTIAWEDRFAEDVLEGIGKGCFLTVGLEKDVKGNVVPKYFLSAYDAITYVKENLTEGTVVNVKGNLKYSIYEGNVQINKEINSIYLSKADDVSKYSATFKQTMLLDRDSMGKLDKEKLVYPVYARVLDYTKMYNDKEVKATIPFQKTFELEVKKDKPELTQKFLDKYIKVKKGINEVTFEGKIVEGESLVTITDDDIPEDFQDLIDMEVMTREEVIGKLSAGGSKEKRMVITKPATKNEGEGDEKTLKIMFLERAYEDDDLVLDFMIEEEDEEEVDSDVDSNSDTEELDEDLKFLSELDD